MGINHAGFRSLLRQAGTAERIRLDRDVMTCLPSAKANRQCSTAAIGLPVHSHDDLHRRMAHQRLGVSLIKVFPRARRISRGWRPRSVPPPSPQNPGSSARWPATGRRHRQDGCPAASASAPETSSRICRPRSCRCGWAFRLRALGEFGKKNSSPVTFAVWPCCVACCAQRTFVSAEAKKIEIAAILRLQHGARIQGW